MKSVLFLVLFDATWMVEILEENKHLANIHRSNLEMKKKTHQLVQRAVFYLGRDLALKQALDLPYPGRRSYFLLHVNDLWPLPTFGAPFPFGVDFCLAICPAILVLFEPQTHCNASAVWMLAIAQ